MRIMEPGFTIARIQIMQQLVLIISSFLGLLFPYSLHALNTIATRQCTQYEDLKACCCHVDVLLFLSHRAIYRALD